MVQKRIPPNRSNKRGPLTIIQETHGRDNIKNFLKKWRKHATIIIYIKTVTIQNIRGFEGTVNDNIWRWQQNFEKRKIMLPSQGITKQLLHAVIGVHRFCTPSGENGTLGSPRVPSSPSGVQNAMDPVTVCNINVYTGHVLRGNLQETSSRQSPWRKGIHVWIFTYFSCGSQNNVWKLTRVLPKWSCSMYCSWLPPSCL